MTELSNFNKKLKIALGMKNDAKKNRKVIKHPRISLNKLAEYMMTSDAGKRVGIIEDAKYPQRSPTGEYYGVSREAIRNYFLSGYDDTIIDCAVDELEGKPAKSPQAEAKHSNNIDVLQAIQETDLPDLDGFKISRYNGDNPKLEITGVKVSVYPDIIIRGEIRGQKVLGAIKVHITKGGLNDDACKNVATLVREFLETHESLKEEKVKPSLCIAIDVTNKLVMKSPTGVSQRRKKIEKACTEVAMWWDRL